MKDIIDKRKVIDDPTNLGKSDMAIWNQICLREIKNFQVLDSDGQGQVDSNEDEED